MADARRTLYCLVEGENGAFKANASANDDVGNLKNIRRKQDG
jgi:hypothetical protein